MKFDFREFSVTQERSALKVGTDAMLLGAIAYHENPKTILDVGTGTGVLSLMLAQKYPNSKIHAIDIDQDSLFDCQENFQNSPWRENLSQEEIDFNRFETTINFDLIITNPPFYENALKGESYRNNLAKHEHGNLIEEIFSQSFNLLSDDGVLWIILPYSSSSKWSEFAKVNKLILNEQITIFAKPAKPKRSILAFRKMAGKSIKLTELQIRTDFGEYSEDYKALTKSFHSKDL